jgi:uncharacterized protein YkwD
VEKHTFGLIIFFFFLSPVLRPAGSLFQESVYLEQRPDVSSIAKSLLDRINNERQARNLPLLILSSELSSAARNHCLDMAVQEKLTHLSSSGLSYQDRLVANGFYFQKTGENVAWSETFLDKEIHQGLMESPRHRENILDPDFNSVGIGVVYRKKDGYYITQDFLQTLNIFPATEAAALIQEKINKTRREKSLPPLHFSEEANASARSFSLKKAKNEALSRISDTFGETHIRTVTTPTLSLPENIKKDIIKEIYEDGGVGICFCRMENYPGGAYLITLFLFPSHRYNNMEEKDFVGIFLEGLNRTRKQQGLPLLQLDGTLSPLASQISHRLKTKKERAFQIGIPLGTEVLSYGTENPEVWPAAAEEKLYRSSLRRIGVGISSRIDKKKRTATFWVTIIFRN